MYPAANDAARQVLLGFNEKVNRLEKMRFYQRYKDEPPNLLMYLDRIDRIESCPADDEPRITLNIEGYMRFKIDNFDREEIEAFVLTYRILTQRNDRYSFHRLADLYGSPWIEEDGRRAFEEARAQIDAILDSTTRIDFGDGFVRMDRLIKVVLYGALAHSDPAKERQYRSWTENPTMEAAVWIEFMAALRSIMEAFRHIRDINCGLLYNLFKTPLPEHLLPLIQETLEITRLPPRKVDAEKELLFKQTVLATGEVNPATLPGLYRRAHILCFARLDGELAGVGALKRPYTKHRARVFRQANSPLNPALFRYELGWFHVLPRFKGRHISSHMVEQLMRHAEGSSIYATSRINNAPMHAALTAHGEFVRHGSEYPSEQGDVPLCLFVRQ